MVKRPYLAFFILILSFFVWTNQVLAGFGISPPYVKSNQIVPGSHYEQKIYLLRSSSEEDLMAEVTVNAPEIKDWISIDKGLKFKLPKGESQVPMIVSVDAPKGADLGNYKGYINIRIMPVDTKQGGGVAIALGARIDVDLTLTNVTYADFIVRLVSISDLEMLGKPWNWKYWAGLYNRLFYKIQVTMNVENIGNVETTPSKVHFDVYDITEKEKLESTDVTSLNKVKAFSTDQVIAKFPTKLGKGQYWGRIRVYKDNDIVNSYKIAFTIAEPGGLGAKAQSLGYAPWLVMAGMGLVVLIILGILIKIRVWRYIIALFMLALRPIGRKISSVYQDLNAKFWKWIKSKAESKTEKFDK